MEPKNAGAPFWRLPRFSVTALCVKLLALQPLAFQHEFFALGTRGDELDLVAQLFFQKLHIGLCFLGQLLPALAAGDVLVPAGQHGDNRLHTVQVGQGIEAGDFYPVQLVAGDDRDLFHDCSSGSRSGFRRLAGCLFQ